MSVKIIKTPEPLATCFKKLNINVRTLEHEPLFTVHDGKDIRHLMNGGHTKNLFLKDKKGKLWLITALESTKIDLKWLPKRIGSARLSFAKPEIMENVLGVKPGSVTPFALINDKDAQQVNVILDKKMLDNFDMLNFHPLVNTKTTEIKIDDLIKFINYCGHSFDIVDFEESTTN